MNSEVLYRAREVEDRVERLAAKLLGSEEPIGIDYVSVFTNDEAEYERLCMSASIDGAKIYEKNGDIYKFTIGTKPMFVRIGKPMDSELIGCGDIFVPDYQKISKKLIELGYSEASKSLEGVDYTIIAVPDQISEVALYLPSKRIIEAITSQAS